MSVHVEKLLVFLASPTDVPTERRYVHDVVAEINRTVASKKDVILQVVSWEKDTFPGYGTDAQSLINAQIAEMTKYALFVGIMWNRIGTRTPRAASGTIEEFNRAAEARGRKSQPEIWFYFCQAAASLNTEEQLEQRKQVLKFKRQVKKNGMPSDYRNPPDFREKLRQQLTMWLNKRTAQTAKPLSKSESTQEQNQNENLPSLEESARPKRISGRLTPRPSDVFSPNPDLRLPAAMKAISNVEWLEKHGGAYLQPGSILLLGGTSREDFHLRVAQYYTRHDLCPSHWSHVAIVGGNIESQSTKRLGRKMKLVSVSLNPTERITDISTRNAIQQNTLQYYDDPREWPNIAIISFSVDGRNVIRAIAKLLMDRSVHDFSNLMAPWIEFLQGGNAPLHGVGIPSAVFCSTVLDTVGLDLTPGLDSAKCSSPEAIWQSAKWWHEFYEQQYGQGQRPKGVYVVRHSLMPYDLLPSYAKSGQSLRREPRPSIRRSAPS